MLGDCVVLLRGRGRNRWVEVGSPGYPALRHHEFFAGRCKQLFHFRHKPVCEGHQLQWVDGRLLGTLFHLNLASAALGRAALKARVSQASNQPPARS